MQRDKGVPQKIYFLLCEWFRPRFFSLIALVSPLFLSSLIVAQPQQNQHLSIWGRGEGGPAGLIVAPVSTSGHPFCVSPPSSPPSTSTQQMKEMLFLLLSPFFAPSVWYYDTTMAVDNNNKIKTAVLLHLS